MTCYNILVASKECKDIEFSEYLEDAIRLRLYDNSPEDKLLGIQIR